MCRVTCQYNDTRNWNRDKYFAEPYTVKYWIRVGRFWSEKTETVYVKVKHGEGEKNNHSLVEDYIKKTRKNARLIRVFYQ